MSFRFHLIRWCKTAAWLCLSAALLGSGGSLSATTYYWDNNGSTAGFGTAGGTWAVPTTGNASQGWSTSSGGTVVPGNITTTVADDLNFGTAANALGGGTITVSGTVTNNTLTFADSAGTIKLTNALAGGTIALGGTSPTITVYDQNVTIYCPLLLLAATTINAPDYGSGSTVSTLTLEGAISGSTSVTFSSDSTVANNSLQTILLNDNSTYTGSTTLNPVGNGANLIVKLGVDNALPPSTVLAVNGLAAGGSGRFARLELNGHDQTLRGLQNTEASQRSQQIYNSAATAAILTISNSANYTFTGTLDDNLTLVKTDSGTQTISGANNFTNDVTINGGVLAVGSAARLNSGTFTPAITIASGAALRFDSTANTTLRGVISGSGGLTNANAGTVTLAGTNTLPVTTANAGTLAVSSGGLVTGRVVVNAGGELDLATNSRVSRTTVNAGGTVSLSGTGTVTNLLFTGSGTMNFNFTSGTNVTALTVIATDGITNSGAAGSIVINLTGATPTNGTYPLINYSGSLRGNGFSAYQIGTVPVGKNYALVNAAGVVQVSVTTGTPSVWVETKADGTGDPVPDTILLSGTSITNFAILRDPYGLFITNLPATWALTNITGVASATNLTTVAGSKSAVFKAAGNGTAKIRAAVPGTNSVLSGTLTVIALTNRPFIWVRASERAGILDKIATNAWATSQYNTLVSREATSLASYQADRYGYLHGLPVDWTLATPLFKTEPTYSVRGAAESKFNDALDCAILYYLTQDPNYAQCAADILHNTVKTLAPVAVTAPSQNGGWIFQTDWNTECRVLATQLPIVYDFIYAYLQTNQVYDVDTASMVNFNFANAQKVFTNYYALARDHGDGDDNWCSLEATAMLNNLLAFDNATPRANCLTAYLTTTTSRQDSLDYDYNRDYNNPRDIWNESLQYSTAVTTIRANNMVLIERYDPTKNLLNVYSNYLSALPRSAQLVYPNKNDEPLYGDGHQGDGASQPYDIYEQVYALAKARGYTNWATMFGGLLNSGINAGSYSRSSLSDYSSLGSHNEPLKLLWSAPAITESPVALTYPRTDALPWAGISLQRNPAPANNTTYGLMCFVGGAAFTHGHASGMNMELFGLGYVLGGKSGRDSYGSALHENYYRLFAGHNTIVVNAGSQGSGGWSGIAINTVQNVAMEPQPFVSAVSSNFSFTCSSFADNMGTLAEATQQRTLAVIRTSPTNGFYVDFFRSVSTVSNQVATTLNGNVTNQFHDYIYRNVGSSPTMNLKTNGVVLGLFSQPNRFQNDVGDTYQQPGWRYFTNQGVSYPQNQLTRIHFAADPGDGNIRDTEMWVAAVTNREYAKVDSPPFSEWVDPSAPGPTVVIRQLGEAWNKPFAVVYEPYFATAGVTVTNVTTLLRSNIVVGLKIESKVAGKATVHYVFSNPNATETYTNAASGLTFKGRFGVVADNGDGSTVLYLGQGSGVTYGGFSLASVGGTNTQAEVRFVPGQPPQVTANAPVTVAAPFIKANNTTNLALDGSWLFGTAPTATGVAIWDSTVTAANTTVLGTNDVWGGIQILNPGGLVTVNAGSTLTNNGDIDMSLATTNVILNCGVVLGAASVWDVTNARTLTVGGVISGAQTLTKQGAGTAILTNANTYSGATTVSEGVLTMAGNRTVQAVGVTVGNVSGKTGTLNVSNGTFIAGTSGSTFLVGAGGIGILNQSGGSLTTTGNQLLIGNGIATGTYNLSGGTLTTVAGSLGVTLGVNSNSTATFNLSGTGTLTMPATSTLQITRSDNSAASVVSGTFNQTGGTATIGILQVGGSSTTPANNANANATLNVSGGTFAVTTFNQLSGANNSTSSIAISGSADVTLPAFPTIRGTGSKVTISFDGGTLRNLVATNNYLTNLTAAYIKAGGVKFNSANGSITIGQGLLTDPVSTGGGLTKLGANTLTLAGTNTYTGGTTVSNGTLVLKVASLATNATVTVASNAVLQLDFATTNRVAGLITNGVSVPLGVYKAANAAPFIAGSGSLQVTGGVPLPPVIAPATVSGTNLVVSVATMLGANYVLQSATNLTPVVNWLNESTNAGTGGNLILNVPIKPSQPRKFLRFWVY